MKVALLGASMGGGHMQSARELERRFGELGWESRVADVMDFTPRSSRFLHWLYPWMINRAPWLYEGVYRSFLAGSQRRGGRVAVPVRLACGGLERHVREVQPDLVVSTYHLAGLAAARLREQGTLDVPVATFITTFAVHDGWFHPGTDVYVCITEQAARMARARTNAPVLVGEPPVRPQFRPTPLPARRGPKVALVVAGSLGMGPVVATAAAVASVPGWTAQVVSGRNEELRRQLDRLAGVEVHGWVEDMAALMAGADVVVDNAGGSTAKEALAAGRPVVTYNPIAGHGRDDAARMQAAGLTEIVERPADLPGALERAAGRSQAGRALFGRDPARALAEWFDRQSSRLAA